MPVLIGADEHGEKDVVAVMDGFRGNAGSWRELLPGLKARGPARPSLPPAMAPSASERPSRNTPAESIRGNRCG